MQSITHLKPEKSHSNFGRRSAVIAALTLLPFLIPSASRADKLDFKASGGGSPKTQTTKRDNNLAKLLELGFQQIEDSSFFQAKGFVVQLKSSGEMSFSTCVTSLNTQLVQGMRYDAKLGELQLAWDNSGRRLLTSLSEYGENQTEDTAFPHTRSGSLVKDLENAGYKKTTDGSLDIYQLDYTNSREIPVKSMFILKGETLLTVSHGKSYNSNAAPFGKELKLSGFQKFQTRSLRPAEQTLVVENDFFEAALFPGFGSIRFITHKKQFPLEALKLMTAEQQVQENGFLVPGDNSTEIIKSLTEINGIPIKELEEVMRPGKSSTAGFLGNDESLLEVMAADNDYVRSLGLSHKDLARALEYAEALYNHSYEPLRGGVIYWGDTPYYLEIEQTRGSQPSPFADGTSTSIDINIVRVSDGWSLGYSGLMNDMIYLYGFYEGEGTSYRVDPRDVVAGFLLHSSAKPASPDDPVAALGVSSNAQVEINTKDQFERLIALSRMGDFRIFGSNIIFSPATIEEALEFRSSLKSEDGGFLESILPRLSLDKVRESSCSLFDAGLVLEMPAGQAEELTSKITEVLINPDSSSYELYKLAELAHECVAGKAGKAPIAINLLNKVNLKGLDFHTIYSALAEYFRNKPTAEARLALKHFEITFPEFTSEVKAKAHEYKLPVVDNDFLFEITRKYNKLERVISQKAKDLISISKHSDYLLSIDEAEQLIKIVDRYIENGFESLSETDLAMLKKLNFSQEQLMAVSELEQIEPTRYGHPARRLYTKAGEKYITYRPMLRALQAECTPLMKRMLAAFAANRFKEEKDPSPKIQAAADKIRQFAKLTEKELAKLLISEIFPDLQPLLESNLVRIELPDYFYGFPELMLKTNTEAILQLDPSGDSGKLRSAELKGTNYTFEFSPWAKEVINGLSVKTEGKTEEYQIRRNAILGRKNKRR